MNLILWLLVDYITVVLLVDGACEQAKRAKMVVPVFRLCLLLCSGFCLSMSEDCDLVDCVTGPWQEWSECSATCGEEGVKKREKQIVQEAQCGGNCDGSSEELACNRQCCPKDCEFTPWSEWGQCYCAETCDEPGNRNVCHRTRSTNTVKDCGGYCDEKTSEQKCGDLCCSKDCVPAEWSEWGDCNSRCEQQGAQNRTRGKDQDAKCGGQDCDDQNQEHQPCKGDCCPQDCVLGEWSEWSKCRLKCEESHQFRQRHVTFSKCGGVNCTVFNKYQKMKCDPSEYNVDCKVVHLFLNLPIFTRIMHHH